MPSPLKSATTGDRYRACVVVDGRLEGAVTVAQQDTQAATIPVGVCHQVGHGEVEEAVAVEIRR